MRPIPGTVYKTDEIPDLRLIVKEITLDDLVTDGFYITVTTDDDEPAIEMTHLEWEKITERLNLTLCS